MRQRLLLCAAVLAALLASCAPPQQRPSVHSSQASSSDNPAVAIANIQSAGVRYSGGDISAARTIPHDIEVLTAAIESRDAKPAGVYLMTYYRAQARQLLSRMNAGLQSSNGSELERKALDDFEYVVRETEGKSGFDELAKGAVYGAAQTSLALGDEAQAYRYFQKCSDMGQAGCQNSMADAKITGTGGVDVDLAGAAALHLAVYETGLRYSCAGAFSALAISRLVHFTGIGPVDGRDELDWIRRAYALADRFRAAREGVDVCGASHYAIYEYLVRLEAGERKPELLDPVVEEDPSISSTMRATVELLRGKIGDREYRDEVSQVGDVYSRCHFAFLGLWHSGIGGGMAEVQAYRDILAKDPGNSTCAESLLYARKYLK